MKINTYAGLVTGANVLLSLALFTTSAVAAPAIVLSPSICDNQAEVFGYAWKAANVANTQLFFVSGNTALNGAINPVGHANAFNASADVNIFIHSNTGNIGNFTGAEFAALFLANHAATPNSVNLYACNSGTVAPPPVGVSSMAQIARSYPGLAANSTLIAAMTAPGPGTCPAQRGSAGLPIVPVLTIAASSMRTGVLNTPAKAAILNTLVTEWNGGGVVYPGTAVTFQAHCTAQLALDATGQWVPQFITDVSAQFGVDYLALINTNYGGNNLVTCGVGAQCN